MTTPHKIAFLADDSEEAQLAYRTLTDAYDHIPAQDADILVVLGGDGFMLSTLHKYLNDKKPIYGMNCGRVGFLMNSYTTKRLMERLEKAAPFELKPLEMQVTEKSGKVHTAFAINEVALLRETRQAAKIQISIDGVVRMEELICDGVMVATPAGSTAYNFSAHGPILPFGADLLALTPVSPFRPRQWNGALLPGETNFIFNIIDPIKRPVSAVADSVEVRDVVTVSVKESTQHVVHLLFDQKHNFAERILNEQFWT